MKAPECADCLTEGVTKYRPIVSGKRVKRCATHARAARKRSQINAHGRMVQTGYRLSPEAYWALYAAQGGRCAIATCRATGKVKRLAVDHDHETGEVYGLLCGPHNLMLKGSRSTAVKMLVSALEYLHNPPARRVLIQQSARDNARANWPDARL